jgi:hypothetical protein
MTGYNKMMREDSSLQKRIKDALSMNAKKRMTTVQGKIREYATNEKFKEVLHNLSLDLSPDLITVQARVLPPLKAHFAQGKPVQGAERGSFTIRSDKLFSARQIKSWVFLHDERIPTNDANNWIRNAVSIAGPLGIGLARIESTMVRGNQFVAGAKDAILRVKEKREKETNKAETLQLIVAVVPNGN